MSVQKGHELIVYLTVHLANVIIHLTVQRGHELVYLTIHLTIHLEYDTHRVISASDKYQREKGSVLYL